MRKKQFKFIKSIKTFPILFLLLLGVSNNIAQNRDIKIIEYQNQPLRELAEKYLGNPDYWGTILEFNNLKSVSELNVGMDLKIPSGLVSSTLYRINEVKNLISDANSSGAKVLTPELIKEAEVNFNKVLLFKQQGNWESTYDSLHDVIKLASKSLEEVRKLRESSANATISFTKGDVEKRKPAERLWSDAELYTKLFEADRARTLSNSIAEITFIDLSRIRLNENSQALIQHSRIDVFKNKTETKVKLIRGNAFAYLLKSPKKKFDIDIPGLDVKIKSKNFWVAKEPVETKIANYEGEIELSTQDVTVVVKKNQGSIIPDGGTPSEPKDLLPAPKLVSPKNVDKFYITNIEFTWSDVEGAKEYWFELSSDIAFRKILYTKKNINNNRFEVADLLLGIYYWRVSAIDKFGLPGNFSTHNYFVISNDDTKPFLSVISPKNMEATKLNSISVIGESEPGIRLFINEKLIKLSDNGKFVAEVKLHEGKNRIVISNIDESGNRASIVRTVFYEASDQILNVITNINFLPNEKIFIINNSDFKLTGRTRPLSYIKFYYNENEVFTYADSNGIYLLNFNVSQEITNLTQTITTPAGFSKTLNYKILLDTKNPILNINSDIPRFTNKKSIVIVGEIIDGDSLFINSDPIDITNNQFKRKLNLIEGKNNFDIIVRDIAGNRVRRNIAIFKDSEPPKLLEYEFKRDSKNKKLYVLQINASDISGLTNRAIVTISVDGVDKEIILRLRSNNYYSKKIFLNKSTSNVGIKSILLEDYIGNSKKYKIK